MIDAIVVLCVILIGFGVLAAIAAAVERLPPYPPLYGVDDEVLPPPEPRARMYRPHSDAEWIIGADE